MGSFPVKLGNIFLLSKFGKKSVSFRRKLVSVYRAKVTSPLTYIPEGVEIRMAMEEHRSIFALYFVILAGLVLLFTAEVRPVVVAYAGPKVRVAGKRVKEESKRIGRQISEKMKKKEEEEEVKE